MIFPRVKIIVPCALLGLFFLSATEGSAQSFALKGVVRDRATSDPLAGANVVLMNVLDTTEVHYGTTDLNGIFMFSRLMGETYVTKITFVGYTRFEREIRLRDLRDRVEVFLLDQGSVPLPEILVTAKPPPVVQVGDTVEFNAAAFKVNPDANAEDVVAKMPGVAVEGGSVKAQGEEIRQVLVDGRQFFGEDPLLALRNLPAEVIEKIQVYDKLSDQAELTGFDDGNSQRTMNIITSLRGRSSTFGRANGGAGYEDVYQASLTAHAFGPETRLSLIGLSNNVNQQNFSQQDILGMLGNTSRFRAAGAFLMGRAGAAGGLGGRGSRGAGVLRNMLAGMVGPGRNPSDFLVGEQTGLTQTHSAGVQYSDVFFKDLSVNGNYFFNNTRNSCDQYTWREYFVNSDTTSVYSEAENASAKNYNHRLNARLEYAIDADQMLMAVPRVSYQSNNTASTSLGESYYYEVLPTQQAATQYDALGDGYNLSSLFVYRYRLNTSGRSISAQVNVSRSKRDATTELDALTSYLDPVNPNSTLSAQTSDQASMTKGLNGSVVYTEPAGSNGLIQVNYNSSLSQSDADKITHLLDPATGTDLGVDSLLSQTSDSRYVVHRAGIGYRHRIDQSNVLVALNFQHSTLDGSQVFPSPTDIRKTYSGLQPMANVQIQFSRGQRLMAMYRTSTGTPSISQLQDVVDNSNPLFLSTGNSELREYFTHMLTVRYTSVDVEQGSLFFAGLVSTLTQDYIATSTFLPVRDTVLPGGLFVASGVQLTSPVNLDGQGDARLFLTYGRPVELISSNVNISAGASYSRSPGLINDRLNMTSTIGASLGCQLASNISEDVDFNIFYNASYNNAWNSAQSNLDNKYYNHRAGAKATLTVFDAVVVRTDLTHTLYSGLENTPESEFLLWTASVGM